MSPNTGLYFGLNHDLGFGEQLNRNSGSASFGTLGELSPEVRLPFLPLYRPQWNGKRTILQWANNRNKKARRIQA